MAINVHTTGRYAGRARVRSNAAGELGAAARWLRADSREVTSLRPRGGRTDANLSSEQAADAALLKPGLAEWRARVLRRRAVVVLRRYAILGAGLSLVLYGLALTGAIPGLAAALPLVPAVVAATVALTPRLSLEQVAQLLDEKLGLFDRISTGLELQGHTQTEPGPLARRAVSDAAGLTELTLQGWRASAVGARPEWSSLAVVAVALVALVVLVPPPSDRSAQSKPTASTGAVAGGPGERRASVRTPAAGQPKPAATRTQHTHTQQSATGIKAAATHQQQGSTSTSHASTRSGAKPGSSRAGTGTQSTSHSSSTSTATAGSKLGAAIRTSSGQATAQGAKGTLRGSASQAAGAVSPVAITRRSAGASPSSAAKAPSSSSTGSAKAPTGSSSSGTRDAGAGRPAGTQSAGHARGSTALGSPKTLSGQATHNLPLQAGYAPSASSKAGGAHGSSSSTGGGGEGRTASTDASAGSGSPQSFTYVPFEGGALAEGDAALLIDYIYSLGFVEEQPW